MSVTLYDRNGEAVFQGTQTGISASTPGAARVLGPFPFAFNTAAINDGVVFYTPTVGDILLDCWVSVLIAFDGTTPLADIGEGGNNKGIFNNFDTGVDVSAADGVDTFSGLFYNKSGDQKLSTTELSADTTLGGFRMTPGKFVSATPWKVWVSQNGQIGGTAVGGTTGSAVVYLVVATPSLT